MTRAVLAIVERQSAARALDRLKTDVIGTVAHDLKGPVGNLLGYADLLLDADAEAPLTPEQRRALTRIRENGMFMLELIRDLLETVRIESGALMLSPAILYGEILLVKARKVAEA
jgi:signal transduction histidine kinase